VSGQWLAAGARSYQPRVQLTIFTTDSITATSMSMPTTAAITTLPANVVTIEVLAKSYLCRVP
jgi:hypothetical protein